MKLLAERGQFVVRDLGFTYTSTVSRLAEGQRDEFTTFF